MPTYEYNCDIEEGGCGETIEVRCSFSNKEQNRPKSCPKCRKRKYLYEVFSGGSSTLVPKTLGHLVDKNSSKISADEKYHLQKKHNEYRNPGGKWVDGKGGIRRE